MRILITGSREWASPDTLAWQLGLAIGEAELADHHPPVIIHGACPSGADTLAEQLCRDHGVPTEPHPAQWGKYGKAAGPVRNLEMVTAGADLCLAFYHTGGANKGTGHCARAAEKAGIEVRRFWD